MSLMMEVVLQNQFQFETMGILGPVAPLQMAVTRIGFWWTIAKLVLLVAATVAATPTSSGWCPMVSQYTEMDAL
ncbi:hypothetical protein RhiTH_009463 [Rhizoctonia solani]